MIVIGAIAAMTCCARPINAQTWRVDPFVNLTETLTNNVDLSPNKRSDIVTLFTPGFSLFEKGPHTDLSASVALPVLYHTRAGTADGDSVFPEVTAHGTARALETPLFVEGAIIVSQQFLSPFGARPTDLSSSTSNRFTTQSYSIAPYLKGVTPGNIDYELRDTNLWTKESGNDAGLQNSYLNHVQSTVERAPLPVGWGADYDRQDLKFEGQDARFFSEISRLRASYAPGQQTQVSVSGGYEDNDYASEKFHGATYGGGFIWNPNDRTNLKAVWEHRFFGPSYHVSFDNHTPLSFIHVSLTRDLVTFPQQIATLPAGADVVGLVNQLFSTLYPDPAVRQPFVDQFILDRGLPTQLSSPVSLFAQEISLQQYEGVTVGTIGARNSILFTIFKAKSSPVLQGPAFDPNALLNNNTQEGADFIWTHTLAPRLTLSLALDVLRTKATPPLVGTTDQATANLTLSTAISVLTTLSAGMRYQRLKSDISESYDEAALIFSINHRFH